MRLLFITVLVIAGLSVTFSKPTEKQLLKRLINLLEEVRSNKEESGRDNDDCAALCEDNDHGAGLCDYLKKNKYCHAEFSDGVDYPLLYCKATCYPEKCPASCATKRLLEEVQSNRDESGRDNDDCATLCEDNDHGAGLCDYLKKNKGDCHAKFSDGVDYPLLYCKATCYPEKCPASCANKRHKLN